MDEWLKQQGEYFRQFRPAMKGRGKEGIIKAA
ncbi:hypothetical protein J2Y64_000397 [Aeromonas salmonicida]|nr:hypothetical protein [Aeromonas salmonicida]